MKKIKILIILIVVGVSAMAMLSTASRSEIVRQPIEQEIEKIATEHFAQTPPSEIVTVKPKDTSKNLEVLAGKINKEYGVREDILRYIEKDIPPENTLAKKTAIKLAQKMQFIYFSATQEEALDAVRVEMIAMECLSHSLPQGWLRVSENIDKMMRDTPDRDKRMWEIDEKYFGWKVLGTGISSTEKMKEICQSGSFE